MENRRTALILSFIYCGLGQIYKRQILKGISFIIIYTPLIAFFILARPSPALHSLNLSIIVLMWLMGMVDAYSDIRTIRWQKLMATLSFAVISGSVAMLLILQARVFSAPDEQLVESVTTRPKNSNTEVGLHKIDDTAASFSLDPSTIREQPWNSPIDAALPLVEADPDDSGPPSIQGTVPYNDVSITAHNVYPIVVEPGAILTINYTISTSRAITVTLGCSVQRAGASMWINDSDNDKIVYVDAGGGNYSRKFALPSTLRPGDYDVAWGIWDSDFTMPYDGRLSSNVLTIVAPATAEDQSSSPEILSNRAAD
ncbi:hypothetical protein ACFL6S_32510 [Candidatus Poribacteria bacterium]